MSVDSRIDELTVHDNTEKRRCEAGIGTNVVESSPRLSRSSRGSNSVMTRPRTSEGVRVAEGRASELSV
jgi:hypothetical protein